MQTRFISIVLSLAFALIGCATVETGQFEDPPPGMSAVVVIRPKSWEGYGAFGCPKFAVNSEEYKSPSYGGSARFNVRPGTYKLTTQTSWCFIHPMELTFTAKPGEIVFVRLSYTFSPKPGFFHGGLQDSPWSGLEEISREAALRELPQ